MDQKVGGLNLVAFGTINVTHISNTLQEAFMVLLLNAVHDMIRPVASYNIMNLKHGRRSNCKCVKATPRRQKSSHAFELCDSMTTSKPLNEIFAENKHPWEKHFIWIDLLTLTLEEKLPQDAVNMLKGFERTYVKTLYLPQVHFQSQSSKFYLKGKLLLVIDQQEYCKSYSKIRIESF